jgi:hypothetical protein
MKNAITIAILGFFLFLSLGCGMKVVRPDEKDKNAGTKMVDWSGGKPKIVSTYSCSIVVVANNNEKVIAIGKTEDEARKEVLAKCRDQTLVSICLEKNVKCVAN